MLSTPATAKLERITQIQHEIGELHSELEILLTGGLSTKNIDKTIKKMRAETMLPRKWGDACKECGSTRRHFKTCSQSPQPKNVVKPSVALTVDQYDELRDAMHDKDFQSIRFAMSHKMSPREVNMAVQTGSYADYLNKRDVLEKA